MVLNRRQSTRRSGVVLLIVMAMLALFASVGLTFVFYAESAANISRTARQGVSLIRPNVEAELLLNHFLGQIIHGGQSEYSALTGQELARTLFGDEDAPAGTRTGKNGVSFNGAGPLRYPHTQGPFNGINNQDLPVFVRYDSDGVMRDPERYGTRTPGAAKERFVGGANVPSTYPSLSNCFLAAVNASGEVLLQSFHRPWIGTDPNDTSASAKYKSFRPHKTWSPSFPNPEDGGGDVRNLPFGPGVKHATGHYANDSYWMYTGFPVMTAASGKKYTVLFAPLIMDLDNRVNLSVHGNLNNVVGPAHVSNQGHGRWEVNPLQVGLNAGEWSAMMAGASGRYGLNAVPDMTPTFSSIPILYYSPYDWDGDGTTWSLPAAGSFSIFRSFPLTWKSGLADEWTRHAAKYSYWYPTGDDRPRMHAAHMEAMLRGGGKGSPALTSDLFKMMPTSMSNAKLRNLVTLLSHDFNRPGVTPFVHKDSVYKFYPDADPKLSKPYPESLPGTYVDPASATAPGGEFANFNSILARRPRLNFNRVLERYPDLDANGDMGDATTATAERQKFAKEIYETLIAVTGAKDPNEDAAILDPSDEYRAARWLAQLAVNLVDYIDADDVMTPFVWRHKNLPLVPPPEPDVLFGTELPRLVINEAYAQLDNDPVDLGALPDTAVAQYYRMNCWVELHNPLPPTPDPTVGTDKYPLDGGKARLKSTQTVYRLVLSKPDPDLRSFANQIGTFKADKSLLYKKPGTPDPDPEKDYCIVTDWPDDPANVDDAIVHPVADGAARFEDLTKKGQAFYVIGPKQENNFYLAGRDPGLPVTEFPAPSGQARSSALTAKVDLADAEVKPTILLQRLACPYRPFNNDPANAAYNPFVTVDYVENVKLNEMRTHKPNALAAADIPDFKTGNSVGRRQPFAAAALVDQDPDPVPTTGPKHTFHRQNSKESVLPMDPKDLFSVVGQTLDAADWLPHLDRPIRNPLELLDVSGFRPHELTQQFITAGGKFKHYAPWEHQESLIYRFLEMVYQIDYIVKAPTEGRTPGKINLSTVWDIETFRALCDMKPINGTGSLDQADIDAIWMKIKKSRTPSTVDIPGANDKPFYPFGMGYLAAGGNNPYSVQTGLTSTLMREDPDDPTKRLLEYPGLTGATQLSKKWELLSKIYMNTTTRSNVFAVWVTAGFFEVTDDTVNPPKIGREIGKDDNRHIRHKFFAIVDRTELRMRPIENGVDKTIKLPKDLSPGDSETFPAAPLPLINGSTWTPGEGTWITINPDRENEETVQLRADLTYTVTRQHGANEPIICRCWPGPWPMYDVRRDEKVVPYFTVVD